MTTITATSVQADTPAGRPRPMSTARVLDTIKFLAPELAQRAEAHTKAWRDGPSAAWVIAYLAHVAAGAPNIAQWSPEQGSGFWAACGLRATPTPDEVRRFFAGVEAELGDGPTTVRCLAALIADLARCGVAPLTRIDPASLTVVRAPAAIRGCE